MLLVAITRLATSIEVESKALAADLGGVVYDHRAKLNAGMPVVVLTTPDAAVAELCLTRIRARGHEAVIVSSDDVVRADAMLAMKRFAFEDAAATGPYRGQGAALIANDSERRPWEDITALVRATHRSLG